MKKYLIIAIAIVLGTSVAYGAFSNDIYTGIFVGDHIVLTGTATSTANGSISTNGSAASALNCFAYDGYCAVPHWLAPLHGGFAPSAANSTTTANVQIDMEFDNTTANTANQICYNIGSSTTTPGSIILGIYGPIPTENTMQGAPLLVKTATTTATASPTNAQQCVSITPTYMRPGRYYSAFYAPNAVLASFMRTSNINLYTGFIQNFTNTTGDLPIVGPAMTNTNSDGTFILIGMVRPN